MRAAAHGSQNAGETSGIGPRGAAVITPYFLEPLEVLERCHRSCKNQDGDWPLRHVMVADGHPQAAIDTWDVDHITLPRAHGDNGNSPAALGRFLRSTRATGRFCFSMPTTGSSPGISRQ